LDRDWITDPSRTVWPWARELVQYEPATFDQLQCSNHHEGLGHQIELGQSAENYLAKLADDSDSCAAPICGAALVEHGSDVPWKPVGVNSPLQQPIKFAVHRAGHDATLNTTGSTTPFGVPVPPLPTRHEGVEGINDGLSDLGVLFVLTATDTDRANRLAVEFQRDSARYEHAVRVIG